MCSACVCVCVFTHPSLCRPVQRALKHIKVQVLHEIRWFHVHKRYISPFKAIGIRLGAIAFTLSRNCKLCSLKRKKKHHIEAVIASEGGLIHCAISVKDCQIRWGCLLHQAGCGINLGNEIENIEKVSKAQEQTKSLSWAVSIQAASQ